MEIPSELQRVAIAYPSGNVTAVVFDQILSVDRTDLNARVIQAWERRGVNDSGVEQCCLVTLPTDPRSIARVEMLGGEFCGNAIRSVVQLVTEGKNCQGVIEASGTDQPLRFSVIDGVVAVEMPIPATDELVLDVAEGTLVRLDGITHLVVATSNRKLRERRTPRQLLNEFLTDDRYGLTSQPAVGVSYYDTESERAEFSVWVRDVNTVFDETACGSGTCAIGIAFATRARASRKLHITQPSGEKITVEVEFDGQMGKVVAATIAGEVSVLYDGKMVLS